MALMCCHTFGKRSKIHCETCELVNCGSISIGPVLTNPYLRKFGKVPGQGAHLLLGSLFSGIILVSSTLHLDLLSTEITTNLRIFIILLPLSPSRASFFASVCDTWWVAEPELLFIIPSKIAQAQPVATLAMLTFLATGRFVNIVDIHLEFTAITSITGHLIMATAPSLPSQSPVIIASRHK
ncbi:hypothetical protein K439DRAFT_1612199 [Ramaria rubella]|nr:hypothetical protein K439DRAFT_1612199 [Ramaria rubella]